MWELKPYADYQKRLKKLSKSNRQEVLNVHDNLAAFRATLCNGLKPLQVSRGWIHAEPMGVLALDASGPGARKKAIRLYVFPDEELSLIHVLTIGDKGTQSEDIKRCKEFVAKLREDRESTSESHTDSPEQEESATDPE